MKTWLCLCMALAAACSSSDGDGNHNGNGNTCGDGVVGGTEQCDDGNTTNGDGCSATCSIESASGSCGDGIVGNSNGETCDDGNTTANDGCSATCTTETGWTCTGQPSTCQQDDGGGGGGNAAGSCQMPYELTLMDTGMGYAEGVATGDTSTSTDQVAEATCDGFDSGAGKDHIWKFTLAATSDVYLYTDETSAFDTVLRVETTPCDATTELPEYTGADGCSDGEGASEFLGYVALPAGTYYVVLDGYMATDEGMYSFTVDAMPTTCGDGVWDYLEFCDDGNTMDGDGCNAKCEVEDGYTCDTTVEPAVCAPDNGGGGGTAVAPAPGDLVINEFMAADNASDTNCDGSTTGTADEFIELVNVSNKTLDMTGVTIEDSVVLRHTFGAKTVAPGKAIVVWNAGTPMCTGVGPTMWEIASSGQLGLNDDGDTISVKTAGATPQTLATVTYPAATLNVSNNLSPDITGTTYALHNAVAGAVGNYSPGKKADGTAF